MIKRIIFTAIIGMMSIISVNAQSCGIENKAFKSGEFLVYDLYFNWKFVWVKVGSASMSTMESRYAGKKVFRSSLTTRGNQKLDGIFVMRDTLLSYCDAATLRASATTWMSCGIAILATTAD